MPMYEFRCPKCGHVFEELVFNSSDEESVKCPSCGATGPEKQLSAFNAGSTGDLSGSSCSSPSGFS